MRWTGSAWTAVPGIKQYNGSSWSLSKASGWDQNVARQFASDVTSPILAIQRILSNMHADGWNPWASTQSTSPPLANWCQRLSISGSPTGGTFTLTYGANTTSAIAYNATALTVQTALNALASVQAIGVARVLGPAGTAYATATGNSALPGAFYTVVFPYPASTLLTANSSSLTGGSSPTVSITTTPVGGTNINWNGRWTWDGTQSGANGLNNQVNFDTNEWTDAQGAQDLIIRLSQEQATGLAIGTIQQPTLHGIGLFWNTKRSVVIPVLHRTSIRWNLSFFRIGLILVTIKHGRILNCYVCMNVNLILDGTKLRCT